MDTKKTPLKKILYIIIPLVIIAFVVLKLKNNKEITRSKVYLYDKEQPLNVQVDTLQLVDVKTALSYSGTFEPNKETKISAEIQGKLNEILVDVGTVVKKGQSLILLDNSLLKLQLQTIEIQIEGLLADVNRYSILVKADAIQGVQLEKTELALKTAKVQRATLLEQLSKTIIKAAFDGIITAKLTEVGAFAAPGIPLLQLTDIALIKFTLNVPENDLFLFKLNQHYAITADAYSDISLTGKLSMIGSKANMGSGFPIQFIVSNTSDLKIKAGMFGKVQVRNESSSKGIIIPASAIVGMENQAQVYLVINGKAKLQNIEISSKIKNTAVVSNGLKAGDVLVTNGFINLFDGANITVN